MRRALFLIFVLISGIYLYIFYRDNLSGALPAILPPGGDIVKIFEEHEKAPGENLTDFPIKVPDGYRMSIFASGLEKPRDLLGGPSGEVFVSDMGAGSVFLLDEGGKRVIISGLNKPHGLEIDCQAQGVKGEARCDFYVAEEDEISVYEYFQGRVLNKRRVASLPTGGRHTTRSILITEIDGQKRLLVSVGSSCDACHEDDPRRGAVLSMRPNGQDSKVYSSGLRNAVFMARRPGTDEVWTTEMGRDFLGDDLPPEEINVLEEGGFYGWPNCYGQRVQDLKFDSSSEGRRTCGNSIPSRVDLQAHSAPLGLAFLDGELLVAYHGSWNRSEPTGYKIVKMDVSGERSSTQDFVTGWLGEDVLGRPVDVLVQNGDIFVSDDKAGVVYRLEQIEPISKQFMDK